MTNRNVTRLSSPYDLACDGYTVSGLPLPDSQEGDAATIAGLIEGYSFAFSGMFGEVCLRAPDDSDINASLADYLLRVSEWKSIGDMTEECDDKEHTLIASALGLRCIADFVQQVRSGEQGLALVLGWDRLCDAHLEAVVAFRAAMFDVGAIERSRLARRAAHASHANRPIAKARDHVRDCWVAWQTQPSQYKTTAAFARDMVDKFPDEITSPVTVERWVRQWRESGNE